MGKYFAIKIFEEDNHGVPTELFAYESKQERWESKFRWTDAKSSEAASRNLRARLKVVLGYTWAEVQRIGFEFGPVSKEEYLGLKKEKEKSISMEKAQQEKYFWMSKFWSMNKDEINIVIENHTVVKEENLFTVKVPIMDAGIDTFIGHYKTQGDNWALVDENDTPLCVFTFRENAEALGSITKRRVVKCFVAKSLW